MTDSDPTPDSSLVLVTGATGFTGGHLARSLAAAGRPVRVLIRPGSDASPFETLGMDVVRGDLTDPASIDAAVRGCGLVHHIAAAYRSAAGGPAHYEAVNVDGVRHMLEACARHGVGRLVHCSTAGVHGEIEHPPADESAPLRPGDYYQDTKTRGEQLVQAAIQRGQPATVFRPVGIHGPGDRRFLKLFRTIRTGRFRMIGPGTALYHLTYIDDLVDGIIACGDHPDAAGETFLLAGPPAVPIRDLVGRVAAAVGVAPPRGRIPVAPVMLAAVLCEALCRPLRLEPPLHPRRLDFFTKDRSFTAAKAAERIGWRPRVSLDEGLARTAAWYVAEGLIDPSPGSRTGAAPSNGP